MLLRLAAALECKVTELVKVFNTHDLGTLVKKRAIAAHERQREHE
jgi:hypothetical protein